LETVVFDSTSSNTGLKNGLAGVLMKARQDMWNGEDPLPKLQIQKCEDHMFNLMSSDYEKDIIETSNGCVMHGKAHKKHRATDVVQFLIYKVGNFLC
jgi:hypothetical protein